MSEEAAKEITEPEFGPFTIGGVTATATIAFAFAYAIHWIRAGKGSGSTTGRVFLVITIFWGVASFAYAYMKRQWLQYLRLRTLSETSNFVTRSHNLNSVLVASMALIQEVELVSRGYRLSTPLPPISRLEDRSQQRRCTRLRKALRNGLVEMIPRYNQACLGLKPLAELVDLEKYFDIYDINELDLQEASLGYTADEFDDDESMRVLKILIARFHTIRKVLFCCLLALSADGGKLDFHRWGFAVDELQAMSAVSEEAEVHLSRILSEEETRPVPPTPKLPLTPGRERWRGQLRKLNSLSSGIRSLQAKMHVLREESDKALDESSDLSELGPSLMHQYESVGADLRLLMQEWEDGKLALAGNIERNERRISNLSGSGGLGSGMLSPALSLSGITSVEEGSQGSPSEALKALNGDRSGNHRLSSDFSSSDAEEVFEAVALPRQRDRSSLTREQRIEKMREERERRELAGDRRRESTNMLRELESVINLKARPRERNLGLAVRGISMDLGRERITTL